MADSRAFAAATLDPARSVVVEACAGSGKTWLLVSRILRLLLAGAEPGEILAITFTRQAAQEMADRLHQWLRLLAMGSEDTVRRFLQDRGLQGQALDGAIARARELYERVLIAQPPLTISTFHSWFLQLLRSAPLEAAAVGNVTLIERTSALLAEAWTLFAEQCRREPDSKAARSLDLLFERYGLYNTRMLLQRFVQHRADWWAHAGRGARALDEVLARQAAALGCAPGTDVVAALFSEAPFLAAVRELGELLARNTETDRGWAQQLATALESGMYSKAFDVLRKLLFTDKDHVRARRPSAAQVRRLGTAGQAHLLELWASLADRVQETVQAAADQASYAANEAGLNAGTAFLEHYQELKRDRQLVDFADIEWLAAELLTHAEHAVTMHFKLDSRYRHILLDEFQDTNPQQWLALKGWFDAAVQAGAVPAVFLVGDPKQAIFRFRRADARLFEAAREWLVSEHAAAVHSRDESRRCAQPVLDVVNAVFAAEPAFASFRAHRAHPGERPGRVEVLPLARNPEGAGESSSAGLRDPLSAARQVDEDRRREREAQLLVARLREIVGGWWIEDEHDPARSRLARYGDVMILVRRRTHLQVYERALRHAGMPFVTSRQGGLLDTLEAADLMALLEFLVSPFDDLRLAHALRSPIFACSEEDLLRLAQLPGQSWWQRLQALGADEAGTQLARARELLGRWLDWADRLPVHDVLDRIYFEGDVMRRYERAVPAPMRAAVAANLSAFIQRALEVDSGRYPSLPRFLAELRDMLEAPAEEAPDEGEVACGADAIRIMTVHGAKGLEAPIVWILDAAAARPGEQGFDVLVQWEPGEHAPASFSLLTRSAERSRAQRLELQAEAGYAAREELNLLYVAMTRARQALIVSGCEVRSAPGSWYARVRSALHAVTGQAHAAESSAVHGDDLQRAPQRAVAGDEAPAGAAAGSRARRSVQATPSQLELDFDAVPSQARHAAAAAASLESFDAQELGADLPGPVGRRREGVSSRAQRYGILFHDLMQQATDSNQGLPQLAQRLGLDAAAIAPIWDQACRVMADPELARFFDPARYERALNEWPIVTPAGELRRVDRMVEFADEVWVLDYKSGSRAAIANGELEAQYRAQVEDYCLALRDVFPAKRVFGLIVFADGSRIALGQHGSIQS